MTRIWPVPDEGLGNSWYVAEVAEGLALVADPGRDPRPYLEAAARHGLRIGFTADTHVHAAYPALIAAVADHTQPSWRARASRPTGSGATSATPSAWSSPGSPTRPWASAPPAARSRSPLAARRRWITGKPGGAATVP